MSSLPLTYRPDANVLIMGVGLMGQHMAQNVLRWLDVKTLVIADHADTILVDGAQTGLSEFAASVAGAADTSANVVAETVDVTSEDDVSALLGRHGKFDYLLHTAGIAPSPLTAPEDLTKDAIMRAYEVNLWGVHNLLKQGVKGGSLHGARGVIMLSIAATNGAEGRSSSAYEESKGGLLNLVRLQARHYVDTYGLVLNGISPSPLRGPMAEQHPVSAGRLKAVEAATPLGGLTEPKHISSATMFFWADECWCVGEVLTTDGGYTKHKPIFGPLPGAS